MPKPYQHLSSSPPVEEGSDAHDEGAPGDVPTPPRPPANPLATPPDPPVEGAGGRAPAPAAPSCEEGARLHDELERRGWDDAAAAQSPQNLDAEYWEQEWGPGSAVVQYPFYRVALVLVAVAAVSAVGAGVVGYAVGLGQGRRHRFCPTPPASPPAVAAPAAAAAAPAAPTPSPGGWRGRSPPPTDFDREEEALGRLSPSVRARLEDMSPDQWVGQMAQLPVGAVLPPGIADTPGWTSTPWDRVDRDALRGLVGPPRWVGSWHDESLTNGTQPGALDAGEWRAVVRELQQAAADVGAPPMLFGADAGHGAQYVKKAAVFPHQINVAATFDPGHAATAARTAARDLKAAGIAWAFAPVLGVAVHPAWPRFYETYGEDPLVVSRMGAAAVRAMQRDGNLSHPAAVAACAKHWLGYSAPLTGRDRAPADIPDRDLAEYFLPPFRAAIRAGVACIMTGHGELNGEPVTSSRKYLTELLRDEAGFAGVAVSDWGEVRELVDRHRTAESHRDAAAQVLRRTTLDVAAAGGAAAHARFAEDAYGLVADGGVDARRAAVSAGRVMQLKHDLGLLDDPFLARSEHLRGAVGSDADRRAALSVAEQSVVLLRNDAGVLPLSQGKKVLLTGAAADSLRILSGGWTNHRQGAVDETRTEFFHETRDGKGQWRVRDVMRELLGAMSCWAWEDRNPTMCERARGCRCQMQTTFNGVPRCIDCRPKEEVGAPYNYVRGLLPGGADAGGDDGVAHAVGLARQSDVVVVTLSEEPYAEGAGDLASPALPAQQRDFVERLAATGTPVVAVLVMGRPRTLHGALARAKAVVWAGLPGPEGGNAIAGVLTGAVAPSGRLPFSWPSADLAAFQPYWKKVSARCPSCTPEWPFGWGLQYARWEYTHVAVVGGHQVPAAELARGANLSVSVGVRNNGPPPGFAPAIRPEPGQATGHVVLLFVTDEVRSITPEVKRLRGFQRVELAAGQAAILNFTLGFAELSFYGTESLATPVLERGTFTVRAGVGDDCPAGCAAGCPSCASFRVV